MLAYILIMIVSTSHGSITVQQQFADQQTCNAIRQDIDHQAQTTGGIIIAENCYSTQGGMGN